jgi:hypothetical protein
MMRELRPMAGKVTNGDVSPTFPRQGRDKSGPYNRACNVNIKFPLHRG